MLLSFSLLLCISLSNSLHQRGHMVRVCLKELSFRVTFVRWRSWLRGRCFLGFAWCNLKSACSPCISFDLCIGCTGFQVIARAGIALFNSPPGTTPPSILHIYLPMIHLMIMVGFRGIKILGILQINDQTCSPEVFLWTSELWGTRIVKQSRCLILALLFCFMLFVEFCFDLWLWISSLLKQLNVMLTGCLIFCQLEILGKKESMSLFDVVDNWEFWTSNNQQ